MKQQLFILLFLAGVKPLVPSVPRKYYLILQGNNWTNAQAYCRSEHIDLATIESNAEMIQIQTKAQEHQFTATAWIGLYNDINSWRWCNGEEPLGDTRLWSGGQPDDSYENDECSAITTTGWIDWPCSFISKFICFDERNTGNNRYIYYSSLSRSWPAAQTYCRQQHTDLASSRNSEENSILLSKISGGAWFGLHRDSWKWSDQTSTNGSTWLPVKARAKYCGAVYNGQTSSESCLDIKPFFCYRVISAQQQLIRIKVQSDQDVNDPAVKASILEQISEKLKAYGMENIHVKFRTQSDGKVFQKQEKKIPLVENTNCIDRGNL